MFYLCSDLRDMTHVFFQRRLPVLGPHTNEPPSPAQAIELRALMGADLAARFCCWRGRSGNRYVFSVFASADCPACCDAVLLVAACGQCAQRKVVAALDTGAFPEPVLMAAKRDHEPAPHALEFHLRLLAATPRERESVRADLTPGADFQRLPLASLRFGALATRYPRLTH